MTTYVTRTYVSLTMMQDYSTKGLREWVVVVQRRLEGALPVLKSEEEQCRTM